MNSLLLTIAVGLCTNPTDYPAATYSFSHPESQKAFQDRSKFPLETQANLVYLSLCEVPADQRERLADTLRFFVPSLSNRPHLGDQIPLAVPGSNLMRLDLGGLGWEKTWPSVIHQNYSSIYRRDFFGHAKSPIPLVVSGAWFVSALSDPNVSKDAQYQLLYSGKPPKNVEEFQKFWKVNSQPDLFFGRIEGNSGVAVQKGRLMVNHPSANRGYSWQTFDSRVVAGASDPLENLVQSKQTLKHDATELICAIPKYYGGRAGTLQAYFLANDKGLRQEKAPADIVKDDTEVRGVEIRNTISCIACHVEGLRLPTLDEYRTYILSGAQVKFLKKADQQEVDRFFDSPIAKEIGRNNEDYAAGVELCNQLTPQQNAANFRAIIQAYDSPVTLEQAALELYTTPELLRYALADYSRRHSLTGRLVALLEGQPITRQQWEANYYFAQQVVSGWQAEFSKVLK